MTFGNAIARIKIGRRVARKGWNGKGQYIELAKSISYVNADGETVVTHHEDMGSGVIVFVGTRGIQLGWLASQADILADDWVEVKL